MNSTVLVVDDSLTVRMNLAEALSSAGFRTVLCSTAGEARQALQRTAVDAVILDVLLPDGNGVDLLHELRTSHATADVPVLMLSAEAEVADRVRALKTGADEYVGKPYDAAYVTSKLEELVRSRSRSAAGPPGRRAPILLIDDSPTFRQALRQALEEAGYAVAEASSGEEGLRLAAARHPLAVVVDGVLPGIDGPGVIRHLRLDPALRDTPCLLLTGSEGRDAELRALDAGADAFIRKTESWVEVLARLAAVLRRARQDGSPLEDGRRATALKTVLAVDDSVTYLNRVSEALRADGYDVICAHSGEEALQLLAVQRVDCILLDMVMPGLGGRETCERIKAAPVVRTIPVIMLTAVDDREAMIGALAAGADEYVAKSDDLEVLRAHVRAQIRRKQVEDDHRAIREELLRREIEATEARAARELAETRAALVDELERKNRELEAFSYSVSHDLRAPLRAVSGFTRILLADHAASLSPKGLEYLQQVAASAARMGELIDALLELSRIGRAELRRTRVDLSALARDVIAELYESSSRDVQVVIEPGLVVSADPRLMRIVLQNLLGNSWKFTAHVPEPQIEVGSRREGSETVYFVRDNGAGFDGARAGRLFRPFQRLHGEAAYPGTGIGLATVHRIIDRHGGRVWAQGEVDRGATFSFTLPAPRAGLP